MVMSKYFRVPGLRTFNNFLSLIVLVLAVYIVAAPFMPQVSFAWRTKFEKPAALYTAGQAEPDLPAENTLVIPNIHFSEPIHEGPDASTLRHGAWRRPHTSTPDHGGNTVIVGHRFTYSDPQGTFYHLDKLKTGDTFTVFWDKKIYHYEVAFIKVVSPDKLEIEAETKESMITLYTCTPLWNAKDRLVVGAVLTGERQ